MQRLYINQPENEKEQIDDCYVDVVHSVYNINSPDKDLH
jgi:hypothetical protein